MITVRKYSASWCNNCGTLTKMLAGKDYEEVDIENNMEEARELNIRQLPTCIFFKDGEIIERITGLFTAEKFDELVERYK